MQGHSLQKSSPTKMPAAGDSAWGVRRMGYLLFHVARNCERLINDSRMCLVLTV